MPTAETKQRPALEDIAARTLTGDVRDFLMQWGKNLQKPWPQMNQREQELFRDACARQAENLVRKVTHVVGAQDHLSLEITTRDFNRKGERLEAKITTPYSLSNLDALARASDAGPITLSVVSLEQYRGERAPAKVLPDQPDLMDEGGGLASASGDAEALGNHAQDLVDRLAAGQQQPDANRGEQQDAAEQVGDAGGATAQADAGDDLAAAAQRDALGLAGEGPLTQDELDSLGPEQRDNVDRLAGMLA